VGGISTKYVESVVAEQCSGLANGEWRAKDKDKIGPKLVKKGGAWHRGTGSETTGPYSLSTD